MTIPSGPRKLSLQQRDFCLREFFFGTVKILKGFFMIDRSSQMNVSTEGKNYMYIKTTNGFYKKSLHLL